MPSIHITIQNKIGLHARPAAQFVREAKKYESDILVSSVGHPEVSAKSILSILGLGIERGMIITIRAEGSDADMALAGLFALNETNFGERE